MNKFASAHRQGGIKDGKGTISTDSGALKDQPYGFKTRFEDEPGTNPEELIGGAHAAKAGCPVPNLLNAAISLDAKREP